MVCRRGRHLPEDQPKEQGNRVRFKSIQFQAGSGHLLSSHEVTTIRFIRSTVSPEDVPANYSEKFNGIKVDIKGLNLYYIFNNRKFSYPAAFSQSTNQRRNAGSFIAGFSISKHNLEFDYAELPDFILEAMNPAMKVNNIKYTNANISFGYAYNWVFARNCLACLSLTPAIAYKASDVDAETHEGRHGTAILTLDFLIRAGVVYNNGKYFVGTSFVGKNYNYHRNNFSLDNGFGTLQIYVGFNFNLRKEYRRKNTR